MLKSKVTQLGRYKGLKITKDLLPVSAEDIDLALIQVLQKYAAWVPVDRMGKTGDRITADFIATLDGEPSEDYTTYEYSMIAGTDPAPLFGHHLIHSRAGEVFETEMGFPEDYEDPDSAGKTLHVTARIRTVEEKVLPELTDAFSREILHCDSAAAFRAEIEEELIQDRQVHSQTECMQDLLQMVVADSQFSIADEDVRACIRVYEDEIFHNTAPFSRAEYLQQLGLDENELLIRLQMRADTELRSRLVLMAIAEEEELNLRNEDPGDILMQAFQIIYQNAEIIFTNS